ncbi:nitrate- and nitrite sensing domain-containing protein [Streptomyces sp. NPDC014779]|uniref:sensor histidine kinase n=1 Tax=Streptomyces sp. NPDC014779 TaxID=3364911 RepID=UPI003703178E
MRTPRRTPQTGAPAQPPTAARGRRAHAGPPADETAPGAAPPAPAAPGHPGTPPRDGAAARPHATAATGAAGPGPLEEPPPVPVPGPASARARGAAPAPAFAPAAPRPRGRGLRPRTVRAKIVSLLMVPVVSLLALWGFATVTTAQDIARLRHLQSVDTDVRRPVTLAITALQDERRAAVRQAAAPGTARAAELEDRARASAAAVARLRLDARHTIGDNGNLPGDVAGRVAAFVGQAEALGALRTEAAEGRADTERLYDAYTAAITTGLGIGGALAAGDGDTDTGAESRVLLELARAGEQLAREDVLLGAAHLTGALDADGLRAFGGAVEARRVLTDSATADLPEAQRAAWRNLTAQPDYRAFLAAEDRVRAAAPGRRAAQAVTSDDWETVHAFVREGTAGIEQAAHQAAAARHDPFGGGAFSAGGAAVLLGLAAVAASLVISVRIGRGLVVELVSLRNGALEIARRKLPAAMRRLRAGEEIDVHAEAPPGPVAQDEIGQVGEALTTVHRAALSAAVERAELASGISGVFVNLARRSQVLVHRQLNLLDSMERRADDPNELGDLFKLDHLTTRMRRHAESLIILSGAAPGRAWSVPVPLTNVVRAAVSEIEDYARVEMRRLPETAVVGGAVADLTHLLAELVENAAQFSPPHTKVRISGEPVGNGYALEIEDRGLGMGKETLAEANARIAQSEALDLFDSDRLGLFVVSRLASRHAVQVHLRTSPYGGTTAVVLLPKDLLQNPVPEEDPVAGAPGPRTAPAPAPGPAAQPSVPGPRPPHARDAAATPAPSGAPAEPERAPAGVTSLRPRAAGRNLTPAPASAPTPPPATAPPRNTAPSAPTVPPRPAHPAGPGEDQAGDLPRRVRQASLVPQLREAPADGAAAPGAGPGTGGGSGPDERTPEQARDRMSAYTEGWRRGGGAAPGTPVPPVRRPLGTGHATSERPAFRGPGSEGDDA